MQVVDFMFIYCVFKMFFPNIFNVDFCLLQKSIFNVDFCLLQKSNVMHKNEGYFKQKH